MELSELQQPVGVMKGYRAVFRGTRGDPGAVPAFEPKRTRWFLSEREAAQEADLLNACHHALAYNVTFEMDDVEIFDVTWYDKVEHGYGEMRVCAPMKEGGHKAAYAYLTLMYGKGNVSIKSVRYVRLSMIPSRF
jgi:hypothetical protein